MKFTQIVQGFLIFSALFPSFALGKTAIQFGYGYAGRDEAVASIDGFEASRFDRGSLPDLGETVRFRSYGNFREEISFRVAKENGCDVVSSKRIIRGGLSDGKDDVSVDDPVRLCGKDVFFSDRGRLLFIGLAPFVMDVKHGAEILRYDAVAIFRQVRSGKDFYFRVGDVVHALKNSRAFLRGEALRVHGSYGAKFVSDFVIPSIGYAKANSAAKRNLVKTCQDFFGGQIVGEISYERGSFSADTMAASSTASGVCFRQ